MITAKNVTKNFGKLVALDKVNFSSSPGACIALIGPNGSGKTTLLKSMLGFVLPDSGSIQFNGMDISNDFQYRKYLGYMPQISRYPENMTIRQLLEMIKDIRQVSSDLDEELIEKYRLTDISNKRMHTLSGGTRQKVSACIAFLFNPALLILDEPTAGLDPVSSEILKEKIIKERNKGKIIIISSHILSEMDDMVSEVVYMQDGSVLFQKYLSDLQTETGELKLSKAISNIMRKTL